MKLLVVFLLSIQLINGRGYGKPPGRISPWEERGGKISRSGGSNADRLLDRLSQVTAENCKGGAADNVVNVRLNYGLWEEFTPIATKTANEMSAYLTQNRCSAAKLPAVFYFNEITANIMDQVGVFASSITVVPGVSPLKKLWAPYSFKVPGGIKEINIGDSYDYTTPNTPYWEEPSSRNYDNVRTVKVKRQLKYSKSKQVLPVATRRDGRWSKLYFDCGGGNTWITTHTSPILCRYCKRNKNVFKGVAYIDIDVGSKDINQCSYEDSRSNERDAFNDLFRGTDRCQGTTRCRPKSGVGLKRGGYVCVCKPGYYMPRGYKAAFDGVAIENAYKANKNLSKFNCIRYRRPRRNKFNKWYTKRGISERKYKRRNPFAPGEYTN